MAADGVEPSAVFWRDLGRTEFGGQGGGRSSLLCSWRHQQRLYDDLSADSSRHGC